MKYRITLTTDNQHLGEIIESENTEHTFEDGFHFIPTYRKFRQRNKIFLRNDNYIVEGVLTND
jgi:hypothetical protein